MNNLPALPGDDSYDGTGISSIMAEVTRARIARIKANAEIPGPIIGRIKGAEISRTWTDELADELEVIDVEVIETTDEIEVREPTKRVQVVYGRWRLPVYRRAYTYETDLDLAVGDIVLVPPTPVVQTEQEATVVLLGSDYAGWVNKIIELVERRDDQAHPWNCDCRECDDHGTEVR